MGLEAENTATAAPESGSDGVLAAIEQKISAPVELDNAQSAPVEESVQETAEAPPVSETDETIDQEDVEELSSKTSEEAPDKEESAEEEDEALELESGDLAQILGVDEKAVTADDEGNLTFFVKADGETHQVKMKELVDSFQLDKYQRNTIQKVAEEKKAFEEHRKVESQRLEQALGEAAAVTQAMEHQLTADYQRVDWEALRRNNPAEWSARKQEFTERVQTLNDLKAKASSVLNGHLETQGTQDSEAMQEHLRAEAEALKTAIPSWQDETVAKKELEGMNNFLMSPGTPYRFTEEEVSNVTDHRLIMLALDAQKYRESMQQGKAAVKKIKKLPKFVKTAKAPSASAKKKTINQQKKIRLKRSGSMDAVADVLMDRIS